MNSTEVDGILFSEEAPAGATLLGHLHVEISRQNSNLLEVKRRLASKAKERGANAVINFRYGQRAHHWIEQLFNFKWDSESWHGEGDAARI